MLLVCVHFEKNLNKLCYDLNSYYWRVVMIIEYNMIKMIMIVKAVIKKHTCKILPKELFCIFQHILYEICGLVLLCMCRDAVC